MMASQGPNYSGSTTVDGGNGSLNVWNNSGNAAGVPDASYADITIATADYSDLIRSTSHGFAIPAGATIDGILAEVYCHASLALSVTTRDWWAYNQIGTAIGTSPGSATWTLGASDGYIPAGGASDLWGAAHWSVADINAVDFGIGFSVANASASNKTAFVDTIRVTVYYTPAPFIDHDDDWPKTTIAKTQQLAWKAQPFNDDETARGTPPTPFYLEQEDAVRSPMLAVSLATRAVIASLSTLWHHDEIASGLHNFGRDTYDDYLRAVQSRPWLARDFAQDDPIVHAHNFYRHEDDDYLRRRIGGRWVASPQTDDELGTQLKLFGIDQHDDYSRAVQSVAWLPRPFSYDERLANAVDIPLDEERDYGRQRQSIGWTAAYASDDELGTGLLLFGLDQHDDYLRAVQLTPWLPKPASDDEALPGAAFYWTTEEDDFGRAVQAVSWAGLAYRDDEVSGGATNFYRDQEDDYSRAVQVTTWQPRPLADDEAFPGAVNFPLDQQDDYLRERQSIAWLAQPFTYDERGPLLKNFGLEIEQHDQPLIRQWFKHQLAIGVAIDEASSYVVIDGSGHRIRAELFMRPRLRAIVG